MSKEMRKQGAPLKMILIGEIFIYLNLTLAQVGPVRLLLSVIDFVIHQKERFRE